MGEEKKTMKRCVGGEEDGKNRGRRKVRDSLGKMTIKCHLNFIWTIKGLQLQLGQIRVQLGQIRVSPLFVQMKFKPNDKITLPLHKTK